MNKEFNIAHLVSYITGNCSKQTREMVEQWLALSNNNVMLFDDLKKAWDHTSVKSHSHLINIDEKWNDFKIRANFIESVPVEVVNSSKAFSLKSILYTASRVAALIVIVFGLYLLFDKGNKVDEFSYTSATAQTDTPFVLPDGSDITMNAGAKVDYPEYFASDIREINFRGEAFFDIAHNPDQPMIIASDNVRVKVLGTSFNLSNCIDCDEITVYLETGKVLFYSVNPDNGDILEQIILAPGQKGIYNKNTGLITKQLFTNNNHLAWKTGILEFVNAPLPEVIEMLENTYNINVDSELPVSDYLLTARFKNETPESIFESFHTIFGLNYKIDNNSVLIY